MKDSQPYHCWWCSSDLTYKFLLLLHRKRCFLFKPYAQQSLSTVCYCVSPSPVDSQVLSNRHEQVLRSVVPLTLLCPVSGGPLQLVIPNLHTSSKDLTYSRHRRGDITSSTCCACHHIKAPHLVLTQQQPAQDPRSRTSFLPSELKPSWVRAQH